MPLDHQVLRVDGADKRVGAYMSFVFPISYLKSQLPE